MPFVRVRPGRGNLGVYVLAGTQLETLVNGLPSAVITAFTSENHPLGEDDIDVDVEEPHKLDISGGKYAAKVYISLSPCECL